jgi:hypothetical protein
MGGAEQSEAQKRESSMNIRTLTEKYRLKTREDECGDKIIPGKRGHLYFDGGELCLMVTDGSLAHRSKWEAIGGKLWMGDIGLNAKGRRVQDVKITGIPLENAKAAIRMARCKAKRILSPEVAQANRERLLNLHASRRRMQLHAVESFAGYSADVEAVR